MERAIERSRFAAMIAIRVLLTSLLLTAAAACWGAECTPSARRARPSVLSPDGRYKVLNVLCSKRADDTRAVLVLLDVKTGVRRTLYPYARDATVVWSPDSHRIAINDYAGSDFTNNLVYSVDPKEPPIDLQKLLDQGSSKHGGESAEADHLYYSVINWRSANQVKLLAWGHGGGKGFCGCYLLSLTGKVGQCQLRMRKSNPEDYCETIKK